MRASITILIIIVLGEVKANQDSRVLNIKKLRF